MATNTDELKALRDAAFAILSSPLDPSGQFYAQTCATLRREIARKSAAQLIEVVVHCQTRKDKTMETKELYWLPMPGTVIGGEHRTLELWQDQDGTYAYCWRNREEFSGFVSIDEARAAALSEAAERWPGLVRADGAEGNQAASPAHLNSLIASEREGH